MMMHPSYKDLMESVNNEAGAEEPVVSSRYSIVIACAKRAGQIIAGDEPTIENTAGMKPLSIAVEEIYENKVKILGVDESSDDRENYYVNNDILDVSISDEYLDGEDASENEEEEEDPEDSNEESEDDDNTEEM